MFCERHAEMKSLNFLYVVPKYANAGNFYFFPIGMAYVMSNMQKHGFNVFCVNLCHSDEPVATQIYNAIEKNNIDVVCTGAMTMHWNLLKDVLSVVKEKAPGIIIVAGGPFITSEPEIAMDSFSIDFGIIGEGEISMVELAAELCIGNLQPESVNGLIYRSPSGVLVKTGERAPVMDLDSLPMPAYEMLDYDKFLTIRWNKLPSLNGITFDVGENQRLAEILTSRSCPYSCTFCYHPLGNKYRQRSLDNVFEEIEFLVRKYNIRVLNILDELFSHNSERIMEFCRRIKPLNVLWTAQWRVDNVNEELLIALKDSGLVALGLGVESMSNQILKSMKKYTQKEQVEAAFKKTSELNIRTGGNIILGDINETDETMEESLNCFFEHPEYELNLAMIRSIPDSEVWRYTIDNKLIVDKKAYFEQNMPLVNFSKMSKEGYQKCLDYVTADSWLCYTIRGKIVESKRLDEFFQGKRLYSFKIQCPLCGEISSHKHYSITDRPNTPVICKSCRKKLAVSTAGVFSKEFRLLIQVYLNKLRMFYVFRLKRNKFIGIVGDYLKQKLFRIFVNS